MRGTGRRIKGREDRAQRTAALALVGWTAVMGLGFVAEVAQQRAAVRAAAELEARTIFEYIRIARRWNASFGGVFVPVSSTLRPSPWLSHVTDRSGRTEGGRELTLVNPAWMTRQMLELANQDLAVNGHVTSLRPIRPENAPDAWERRALERLEREGAEGTSEVVDAPDGERLRFMGRLLAEASCLRCHAEQIAQVGDVRGGIAVSVPLAPVAAMGARNTRRQLAVHGGIWALGVAGILIALSDHRRRAAAEAKAEAGQEAAEAELSGARRLEAVGRLSSGLAHDFNNLLAPVLSVSGLVRDELPEDSPLRADLEDIRGAALKARELVRALQTLSRKNGARQERIALAQVVSESEELLRRFSGSRLGFTLDVSRDVPSVVADRPLLELALANLVVNAREGAVVGRTIAMRVATAAVSDEEAGRLNVRAGRYAAVTVAEAGAAALPEAPFGPIQGTPAGEPGGAGFGLPTINGIVAQYGGAVVVRALPGAGWAVRLLLPEAPPSDAGSEGP
jgi:C4-dicarboxylate-specific signal transduction histidine kinase